MTNQESINILLNEQKCINRNDGTQCDRKCESCDLVMDAEQIREAYSMAISALEAQDAPDTNVGNSKYTVSATAAEEMLKDLLPERGMWEIEGDEAKNAICETVHDALERLWKLPSAQQEIIYCRDCKYNSNPPEYGNAVCDTFYGMTDQMGYCHMAERRENA